MAVIPDIDDEILGVLRENTASAIGRLRDASGAYEDLLARVDASRARRDEATRHLHEAQDILDRWRQRQRGSATEGTTVDDDPEDG